MISGPHNLSLEKIERACEAHIANMMEQDPAHDLAHIQRVVLSAKRLAEIEQANPFIVVPAAWLHDLVNLPKNHPERHLASHKAAMKAGEFLKELGYEPDDLEAIQHAIIAHSFSANVSPTSVEAKIVQDADRLDALGAIGISRCLMIGGRLGRDLYNVIDPFCIEREPVDEIYTIDHFYKKLLMLADSFQTLSGRAEARLRTNYMKGFLKQLAEEIA